MNIFEADNEYIANTYARYPISVKDGKGAIWHDHAGKEYIDLGSGIAVNVFGAADTQWVRAVCAQAEQLSHTSNLFYSEPQVKLAEALVQKTGMRKVFFTNSGAEANECAIKAARKYGNGRRYKILSLKGSFHGRTLATLAMTGQDVFHAQFQPLPEGFSSIVMNDTESLGQALDDETVCAVIVEVIQGEGGIVPANEDYLHMVRDICARRDILFMVDEIQTGMGRTGRLFAYMHYGLTPDVVTAAKGMGGGLPIGACIMGEKVKDVFSVSDHGSTFGGNPICCMGALSILQRMNESLYAEVNQKSEYIISTLNQSAGVISITGKGLMLGIQPVQPAKEIVLGCLDKGVLVLTAKDKVRLLPPLSITWEQLGKAIHILKEVLDN